MYRTALNRGESFINTITSPLDQNDLRAYVQKVRSLQHRIQEEKKHFGDNTSRCRFLRRDLAELYRQSFELVSGGKAK